MQAVQGNVSLHSLKVACRQQDGEQRYVYAYDVERSCDAADVGQSGAVLPV